MIVRCPNCIPAPGLPGWPMKPEPLAPGELLAASACVPIVTVRAFVCDQCQHREIRQLDARQPIPATQGDAVREYDEGNGERFGPARVPCECAEWPIANAAELTHAEDDHVHHLRCLRGAEVLEVWEVSKNEDSGVIIADRSAAESWATDALERAFESASEDAAAGGQRFTHSVEVRSYAMTREAYDSLPLGED